VPVRHVDPKVLQWLAQAVEAFCGADRGGADTERLIAAVESLTSEIHALRAAIAQPGTTPQRQAALPRFLTIDEAAHEVRVHPETLRRAVHRGELQTTRTGRRIKIRPAHLTAWLRRCERQHPIRKKNSGGRTRSRVE